MVRDPGVELAHQAGGAPLRDLAGRSNTARAVEDIEA